MLRPWRPKSIGFYLLAMVAVIMLPLLAFVILLLQQLESSETQSSLRRTGREALSLAAGIGRQIQDTQTTLRLLATSPDFATADLRAFFERTKVALQGTSMFVIVARADGQQLLNTRVSYETRLGQIGNPEALAKALRSRQVEVSEVFLGNISGKWVFNVTMPLKEVGASGAAALILTQNAEGLAPSLANIAAVASATVLDGSGRIVAAAGRNAGTPGELDPLASDALASDNGVFQNGADTIAFARPQGTDWRVMLSSPTITVTPSFLANKATVLLTGLALLVIALSSALLISWHLRRSMAEIASMAERAGHGEIVAPSKTIIAEINQVAVALTNASYERSEAEHQLWYTMREAVHRTKNMMSVVQAMMGQTARHSTTIEEFRKKMQGRLAGLAHTVDLLTASEWTGSSMKALATSHLATFSTDQSRVIISGDDFILRPEVVQALGMALHELGTNAVKYGALANSEGCVRFSWGVDRKDCNDIVFRWVEELGPPVTSPGRSGFGTAMLESYAAAAMDGRIKLEYLSSGLVWQLTAPRKSVEVPPDTKPKMMAASPVY